MDSLTMRDVRCFHSKVTAPLAPLTILVGENSTGKSTFLAMVRLAWDVVRGGQQLDFNEAPFQLGAFDQIANLQGDDTVGRSESFDVGAGLALSNGNASASAGSRASISARFEAYGSQPRLAEWSLQAFPYSLVANYPVMDEKREATIEAIFSTLDGRYEFELPAYMSGNSSFFDTRMLHYAFYSAFGDRQRPLPIDELSGRSPLKPSHREVEEFLYVIEHTQQHLPSRPYATAPIRSEPRRTYDPIRELQRAAGAHVPMKMAEMAASRGWEWYELQKRLIDFGASSGLFRWLDVKRLGDSLSSPFQLDVRVNDAPFNITDVGYGVSQVLPILVECMTSEQNFFLLQQPEVHLHPRAQAELGSLLGSLVKHESKRFVVETHSDYIIDRIRLDIRDGRSIEANQVVILYFERDNDDVRIHPLRLDETGNVVDAPRSYRQFFINEESRFFGL